MSSFRLIALSFCLLASWLHAGPFRTGDIIALECNPSLPGARWLEARPGENAVVLTEDALRPLGQWRVRVYPSGLISLRSEKPTKSAYLDGDTVHARVALAPEATDKFSGTRWKISELGDSMYTLECAGDIPGSRLLDGRVFERDAILTNNPDNAGSRWRAHLIYANDSGPDDDSVRTSDLAKPRSLIAKLPAAQLDGVALVEGDRTVGTGFFALIRDLPFVVTNQHVLAGNKSIRITNRTGVKVSATGFIFARDRDLALVRIDGDPATLPLLKIADSAAAASVGEDLLIAGNSEGGGTVLQSEGRIVGFGFDRVEHDVSTVSGNSGSPIFRQSTWEVLAIDTYSRTRRAGRATDPASRNSPGTSLADIRHFGVRIDSASDWTSINWDDWQKECAQLAALERRIEGLEKLLTEERDIWITYPDIASRVQDFEERTKSLAGESVVFRREATAFFQALLTYTQNQKRTANQLKERNIGYVCEQAGSLADYASQIETSLRGWDVNVADRLKAVAR